MRGGRDHTGTNRRTAKLIWEHSLKASAMLTALNAWMDLHFDRRAVTALEYALIAGIVVVVIAVGFGVFASNLPTKFTSIGNDL